MAYIRTCVQHLGEIRRPVRNNCPSSLIIDWPKSPIRENYHFFFTDYLISPCGIGFNFVNVTVADIRNIIDNLQQKT